MTRRDRSTDLLRCPPRGFVGGGGVGGRPREARSAFVYACIYEKYIPRAISVESRKQPDDVMSLVRGGLIRSRLVQYGDGIAVAVVVEVASRPLYYLLPKLLLLRRRRRRKT